MCEKIFRVRQINEAEPLSLRIFSNQYQGICLYISNRFLGTSPVKFPHLSSVSPRRRPNLGKTGCERTYKWNIIWSPLTNVDFARLGNIVYHCCLFSLLSRIDSPSS